jgi:hypothetical protein
MTFSKSYAAVLSQFINTYVDAKNEKARKAVVNQAAEAVRESKALLEDAENLPKGLQTVCLSLFSGNH